MEVTLLLRLTMGKDGPGPRAGLPHRSSCSRHCAVGGKVAQCSPLWPYGGQDGGWFRILVIVCAHTALSVMATEAPLAKRMLRASLLPW